MRTVHLLLGGRVLGIAGKRKNGRPAPAVFWNKSDRKGHAMTRWNREGKR